MSTNPAKKRLSGMLCEGDEPGVYQLRVFYLSINGRRSVVSGWQLYETMRRQKLLHAYSKIEKLGDSESIDLDAIVHGKPFAVSVLVGTWQVRIGAAVEPEAYRALG